MFAAIFAAVAAIATTTAFTLPAIFTAMFSAPVIGAAIAGYTFIDQPHAAKEAASSAKKEKAAFEKEQVRLQAELAGGLAPSREKQMKLQIEQQKISGLAQAILKSPEERIYTLPATYEPALTEKINKAIDDLLR